MRFSRIAAANIKRQRSVPKKMNFALQADASGSTDQPTIDSFPAVAHGKNGMKASRRREAHDIQNAARATGSAAKSPVRSSTIAVQAIPFLPAHFSASARST